MMKGNEQDCICAKLKGKHTKFCDAYRLSEFFNKCRIVKIKKKKWKEEK
jgi:hypothetical protein